MGKVSPDSKQPAQETKERVVCPLCTSSDVFRFLQRGNVPVLTNLLLQTEQAAKQMQRAQLEMCMCKACGFVFNAAFEPSALYDEHYDNSQVYAPSFELYLEELARYLVEERHVQNCRVVEVGCGNGAFLRKLIGIGAGLAGVGFDPSYTGPTEPLEGNIRFEPRYYDEDCTGVPADVLICRHVIEHIPQPLHFLRTLRSALAGSPNARVFLETPCVEWILREAVLWDWYYEHCSLFCEDTLTFALEQAGFRVERVMRRFGEQYLLVEATICDGPAPLASEGKGTADLLSMAIEYRKKEHHLISQWRITLAALRGTGPVALLGGAGKGVTFANLLDPAGTFLNCIVDLHPRKKRRFLPGTGHPIVGYEDLKARGVTVAILMNPNYRADTEALLEQHGIAVTLVSGEADGIAPFSPLPGGSLSEQKNVATLLDLLAEVRGEGKSIAFTNGVFDLLHAGHVAFLRYAKTLADVLVVAVDSDASTRRLKGPGRPINAEEDRLLLLGALGMVDYTILFESASLADLLRKVKPQVYVKGGDYVGVPLGVGPVLEEIGAQGVVTPVFCDDVHTSRIIERIQALGSSAS